MSELRKLFVITEAVGPDTGAVVVQLPGFLEPIEVSPADWKKLVSYAGFYITSPATGRAGGPDAEDRRFLAVVQSLTR